MFGHARTWYAIEMLAKFTITKPLVVAGAVAATIAAAPMASADVAAIGPGSTSAGITHFIPLDPGGGGCDANGNCGSGGVNGPNGGPGGQGCIPGVGCGNGGQNWGPGGVPGGQGCLPGVGCGSGHA
jgi:hypothetical protein